MSSVARSCLSAYWEHMGGTCFDVLTLVGVRWWGRAALSSGGSGALTKLGNSLSAALAAPSLPDTVVLERRGLYCQGSTCCTLSCVWADTVLGLGRQAGGGVLHTP